MRAIDTNVLVRLLVRDDARQAAAADRFVAQGGWVSQLVLLETVWVLRSVYSVVPVTLVNALEALLDHSTVVLDQPDVVRAAIGHVRREPRVSIADALILSQATAAGHTPVGSFDRTFARLPGTALLR